MEATKKFIEDSIKGGWGVEHDRWIHHEVNQEVEFCTYFKDGELDYEGEEKKAGQFKKGERVSIGLILLDPLAWAAVGKTRGWNKEFKIGDRVIAPHGIGKITMVENIPKGITRISYPEGGLMKYPTKNIQPTEALTRWREYFHQFIDHLADGLSIDDALAKISNS